MKNKTVAALLALFLGGLGIHKFYLGRGWQGAFYLLFCWTFIPSLLGLIDAIVLFLKSEADFQTKYGSGTPEEERVKCPDCSELVLKDARKCKHCGTVLQGVSA